MIRATALPAYRDVRELDKPEGVNSVEIDPDTLQVATPYCPSTREEVYVGGTEPTQLCELHGSRGPASGASSFLSHIFGGGAPKPQTPAGVSGSPAPAGGNDSAEAEGPKGAEDAKAVEKKKGPLQKIFGIFGDKKKKEPEKPARDKGDSP